MGILDEAIREHLDLKRRRGADPTEVERLEREALGPVRRGGFEHEEDVLHSDYLPEADYPARYGGEEMALILPHTDLEGTYAIAERIRTAIEELRVPRKDHRGTLRITASLGVIASSDGQKDELIAETDAALYEAKRQGKNRTVKAPVGAANVLGAE